MVPRAPRRQTSDGIAFAVPLSVRRWLTPLLLITGFAALSTGCASHNEKARNRVLEEGWIGGEYKLAHAPRLFSPHDTLNAFPASLSQTQKAGVLVLALSANAPARTAGLREGDLLLELNHQPVTRLRTFRRLIEESRPGKSVLVKLWRDGQCDEKKICVGRETFRKLHVLNIGLIAHNLNFRIHGGFSLLVLGYWENPGTRIELAAVDQTFARACNTGPYQPSQQDWAVWLPIIEVSKSKIVLSQEPIPMRLASSEAAADVWPGEP